VNGSLIRFRAGSNATVRQPMRQLQQLDRNHGRMSPTRRSLSQCGEMQRSVEVGCAKSIRKRIQREPTAVQLAHRVEDQVPRMREKPDSNVVKTSMNSKLAKQ